MTPKEEHVCGESCVCPDHQEQMWYSAAHRTHACRVTTCQYAHGYEERVWETLPGPAERSGIPIDVPLGQHPYDWFLGTLKAVLGERKTEQFLGVTWNEDDPPPTQGSTT
jgi:hypothetical protein